MPGRKQSNPTAVKPLSFIESDNRKAARLMQAYALAPDGDVVEVGCLRSPSEWAMDGWSTAYLAEAAQRDGRRFASYDLSQVAAAIANKVLADKGLDELVTVLPGEEGIALHRSIALLYLDGSDDPAQTLEQFLMAEQDGHSARLVPGAMVCIDDVQMLDWDKLQGKGTLLIPYLAKLGWAYDVYTTHPGFSMCIARKPAQPVND